jgi:hypothetical protein
VVFFPFWEVDVYLSLLSPFRSPCPTILKRNCASRKDGPAVDSTGGPLLFRFARGSCRNSSGRTPVRFMLVFLSLAAVDPVSTGFNSAVSVCFSVCQ